MSIKQHNSSNGRVVEYTFSNVSELYVWNGYIVNELVEDLKVVRHDGKNIHLIHKFI